VQSFGKLKVDVAELGVDLASISSHKIYGPKGVGALYVRQGVDLSPRQYGGGQEQGVRTGTENTPGIVGFGEAAKLCEEELERDAAEIGKLRDLMHSRIQEEVDGPVLLNGSAEKRIYLNLNLRFPDVESESLLLALDGDGIEVSIGSACSSGSTKPSHVLTAIGLSQAEAHESLRLTLGRTNDRAQIDYAARRIGYHVNRLRAMAF
jgi:cysteine desulfurase